jgi:hypothetical protein
MKTRSHNVLAFGLSVLCLLILQSCTSKPNEPTLPEKLQSEITGGHPFIIDNRSSHMLGAVMVNGTNGSISLTIDTIGLYNLDLSFAPSSVTINTTSCPSPDTTIVQFPTWKIENIWQNANLIEILDFSYQN